MKSVRHFFLLVGSTLAAFGCTEESFGAAHPELERADVENIDEGDAEGSAYAGRYTIVRFDITRCVCAEGSEGVDCDNVELAAEGLVIQQDDGELTAQPVFDRGVRPDTHWAGGVDADGSFRIGGTTDATGSASGIAIELVEGKFGPAGKLDALWRSRVQASSQGGNIDCELAYAIEAGRSD